MAKKMLINALHAEEARVAIVEDGRLVDLDVEIAGSEQIRGNIYRGVVVRVEPGLQAAFVDVGLKKLGFLQMGEIHPENYRWRDDIPEEQRHRRPRIQEVLRRGQELLVQVEKGERDNKGSALTTYVSLPGRYMVLMPGSDSSGISRKVENESERKKLKEIISEMNIPEGYGYIIRTEAVGRSRDELQKDLDSLIALYEGVKTQGAAMKGAGLIYQESALIIRTIRDYFSADIDEVLVDSKDVFKDVREALKEIDPQFEKLVKMHQEKRPIFSRYQLEEQIDLIYEKKVPLKSGGSIFIEPTEALVSIDVNSGKSTGEKGVEDTAFKTNLEAAEEAARQLRLRDLGGLIVIDFIDMRERKHNAEVEKTLKAALKVDKARVNVSRISEFGLLEMSRQRIRQTLHQASTLECPHCDGRGKVKSVEAMALSFLRKVHAAAAKGSVAEVVGSLPLEVAYYLLNRKRRELSRIESDYDIEVTVKGKPSYLLNQMELELVKREKLPQEELPQEKAAPAKPAKEEAAPEAAPAEGRKKRKKKGKAHVEAEAPAVPEIPALPEGVAVTEAAAEEARAAEAQAAIEAIVAEEMAHEAPAPHEGIPVALVVEPTGVERVVVAEGEGEEQKKKRRRKRRKKGAAAEAAATAEHPPVEPIEVAVDLPLPPGEIPLPEAAAVAAQAEHPAEFPAEHAGEEVKKKRRRRRRRGAKGHEMPPHEAVPAVALHEGAAVVTQEAFIEPEGGFPIAAASAEMAATEAPSAVQPTPAAPEAATPEAAAPEAAAPEAASVEAVPEAAIAEAPAEAPAEAAPAEAAPVAPAVPAKARKPRRPRKKGAEPAEAAVPPVEVAAAGPVAEEAAPEVAVAEEKAHEAAPAEAPAEVAKPQKPKRPRRKKPAKGPESAEGAAAAEAMTAVSGAGAVEAPQAAEAHLPPAVAPEAAPAKAKRKPARTGRKAPEAEGAETGGGAAPGGPEEIIALSGMTAPATMAAEHIGATTSPRQAMAAAVTEAEPAAGEAAAAAGEKPASKGRRPRKSEAAPQQEAAAAKPRKPRAPRKKKEESEA